MFLCGVFSFMQFYYQYRFRYTLHPFWRRQWHPTLVLLPGKSHGRRSLGGCSPWGREESDATEQLHFSLSCIGEGNGNPLQCSCLENPRDRGAWWAAVSGVTQSRTRLKQLSRSMYTLGQSRSYKQFIDHKKPLCCPLIGTLSSLSLSYPNTWQLVI